MKNPAEAQQVLEEEKLDLEEIHDKIAELMLNTYGATMLEETETVCETYEAPKVQTQINFEFLEHLTLEECKFSSFNRWLPDITKYTELARKDKK